MGLFGELGREKLDTLFGKTHIFITILFIVLLVAFTLAPLPVTFKIVIVIVVIVYANYRLMTNIAVSKQRVDLDETLKNANTGDLLLFRSYSSNDIPEFCVFRVLGSVFTIGDYFSHIGMVVRLNGSVTVLESTLDPFYSLLTQSVKDGIILQDARPRILTYDGRVHYVKTDLHKYMTSAEIINYLYSNNLHTQKFLENMMGCISVVCDVLKHFKMVHTICLPLYSPSYFINPAHYTKPVRIADPVIIKEYYD